MCLLLPCFAGVTWGGYKVSKQVEKAFNSSSSEKNDQKPQDVGSVIATEAKLAIKLASFKPSSSASASTSAPPTQDRPTRGAKAKKLSKKEEESKARLQHLINEYSPNRKL